MDRMTPEMIKEIAEQLDCGFRVFIHKTTGQLLFIPNEDELYAIDLEGWEEELELLENNFTDYHEVEKWTSSEGFEIMEDFANQLEPTNPLQKALIQALHKKHPFREFKYIIDNSRDYRKLWFGFRDNCQQAFVKRQLARLKLIDE